MVTASHLTTPKSVPLNAKMLARVGRSEKNTLLGIVSPAMVLVGIVLFVPIGWLFWLSFVDSSGFTLRHYQRLVASASYFRIFVMTFEVSSFVTLSTVLLGYPICYLMSQVPQRVAALILIAVILPFWTSLLVRTYAWMILLQRTGLINDGLMAIGLIDQPLSLVHNFTGTVIGMTHIMLPYLILPLYATMRAIPSDYAKAAASLGADPIRAFWIVFFPLSLPGLLAGMLLVFVLCLGFYVTPALMGGGKVIMISMRIEKSVNLYADWGAASALGVVLLVITFVILLASRLIARRYTKSLGKS